LERGRDNSLPRFLFFNMIERRYIKMSVELDFIPVRGKESTILTQTPREGNIYFATDTGKIYMDVKDELTGELAHLPVGGSGAAVLYAQVADI
jgi:hypothetical protein